MVHEFQCISTNLIQFINFMLKSFKVYKAILIYKKNLNSFCFVLETVVG